MNFPPRCCQPDSSFSGECVSNKESKQGRTDATSFVSDHPISSRRPCHINVFRPCSIGFKKKSVSRSRQIYTAAPDIRDVPGWANFPIFRMRIEMRVEKRMWQQWN